MGFLTRCKRLFSFAFLLQNRNTFFSFFLKSFLILSEKQHRKIDLDETQKNLLDDLLRSASESGETVAVLYFQPDKRKAGGAYSMKTGIIKKIDAYGNCVKMEDGTEIPIEDIMDINDELHIV